MMSSTGIPWRFRKAHRSDWFSGCRIVRATTSESVGGGICPSIEANPHSGSAKTAPAAAGIQRSGTPASNNRRPTVFANPSARMKLQQSPVMKASESRRPSRNPRTRPKTIPSGSPFKNRQIGPKEGGSRPNRIHAASATAINPKSVAIRRRGAISAMTRMPMALEAV